MQAKGKKMKTFRKNYKGRKTLEEFGWIKRICEFKQILERRGSVHHTYKRELRRRSKLSVKYKSQLLAN